MPTPTASHGRSEGCCYSNSPTGRNEGAPEPSRVFTRSEAVTEFMLDSARQQAEEAILDRRIFVFDAESHESFLKLLDSPAKPSTELRELMRRKPPWER